MDPPVRIRIPGLAVPGRARILLLAQINSRIIREEGEFFRTILLFWWDQANAGPDPAWARMANFLLFSDALARFQATGSWDVTLREVSVGALLRALKK